MDFLVIAMDGTDEGAVDRRMAVRADHLAGIGKMKEQGQFVSGGGILDDDGNMIGSVVVYDLPDRDAVEKCHRCLSVSAVLELARAPNRR